MQASLRGQYSTVGELLTWAAERLRSSGSETPRLDAELLLGNVLHVDRTSLLAHSEAGVGPGQAAEFEAAVARRETGEPVAYIRGTKEFYGLALMVDPRALIPRPETELLVDLALDAIRTSLVASPPEPGAPFRVWDVGTGSGAVVVTLAVESRRRGYGADVRFVATDRSPEAVSLATENAVAHGVADVIEFGVADLVARATGSLVHLVVANLPYVPSAAVPALPAAASFEPRMALDGGDDGMSLIDRLLEGLPAVLAESGTALIEVGSDQADPVSAAAGRVMPARAVRVHADLAGRPRVVEIGSAAG